MHLLMFLLDYITLYLLPVLSATWISLPCYFSWLQCISHISRRRGRKLREHGLQHCCMRQYNSALQTIELQLHASYRADPVWSHGQLLAEQDLAIGLTDGNTCILSIWFLKHFEQLGDLINLQQTITILEELVRCISIWDYQYTTILGNLGMALLYQFNCIWNLSGLEKTILRQKDAIDLTLHGYLHKPSYLNNLSDSFQACFNCLRKAIFLYFYAVSILGSTPLVFNFVHHTNRCCMHAIYTIIPALMCTLLPLPSFLNSHGLVSVVICNPKSSFFTQLFFVQPRS